MTPARGNLYRYLPKSFAGKLLYKAGTLQADIL